VKVARRNQTSFAPDGFQNWELNACVVKNDKLLGSADSDVGARTVFTQAEQALDTPFINARGEGERVAKVFIVSPYDCSGKAEVQRRKGGIPLR
jgi:hypothetical protein